VLSATAAVALAAPAAWITWNHHAHGDALHFIARVAAFARASAGAAPPDRFGYWIALIADQPGISVAAAIAIAWAVARRADIGDELRRWARPVSLVAFGLALLSFAALGDAAPTHHPERVTLLATLVGVIAAAGFTLRLAARLEPDRRTAASLALVGVAATAYWAPHAFVDRSDEESAGAAARRTVARGDVVLLQAFDYGCLAVIASLGRPEDVVKDRSLDPREPQRPSSFDDGEALRAALAAVAPRLVIARIDSSAAAVLGDPDVTFGTWAAWPVAPAAR
jgi:hypothetical protein